MSLDSCVGRWAGPGICVLCLADTCTSEVHPVFNHVASYGYLLSDMYLFICLLWQISQIQTFLFRVVGPGLVSTSPSFVSNSASHPAGPHGRHAQKTVNRGPHCWRRGGSTQFAQHLESAVTAPPLVGCVVWSLLAISLQCSFIIFLCSASSYSCAAFASYTFIISWLNILE